MEIKWYYQVIRQSWRLILVCTLVPGIVALLISLVLKPTYESRADVALYKSKTELVFDSRYVSLSEDDLVHYSNPDARRTTLVALAKSGEVISETLARLPENWKPGWSATQLADALQVDTSGNLIHLRVRTQNAQQAAMIGNTWAEVFVEIANGTFRAPQQVLDTVIVQAEEAYTQYSAPQQSLEMYLADNKIDELTLAIAQKEATIESLQAAYFSSAQTSLENLLLARSQVPLLLGNAQTLRQLVANGPASEVAEATQISALLLQIRSLHVGTSLPAELQLSLPAVGTDTLTRAEALETLDLILSGLGDLQIYLDDLVINSVPQLSADLNISLADQLATIQVDLDPLRASLEQEEARLRELTAARDLAWENYLTLASKVDEASLAAQSIETEVVLASGALVPEEPVQPHKLLITAVGFGFGLLASLAFVFLRAHISDESLLG
ncbi:MAG: hypothetical protein JW862_14040 [Anaerolineales bacterium]|nr:hypothetical protein [Anaerolineales bacterium]